MNPAVQGLDQSMAVPPRAPDFVGETDRTFSSVTAVKADEW